MSSTKPVATAQGCIDGINDDVLVGWFHSTSPRTSKLMVFANGAVLDTDKQIMTGRARHDVAAQIGVPSDCGFRVQLQKLPKDKVSRISVADKETGFDFNGEVLAFCPAVVSSRARLRGLFLPEFYRYRYHHESLSNDEAFLHYVQFGIYADHDPNPWFSSAYIRKTQPVLMQVHDLPVIAYLEHEAVRKLSPSPQFDPAFYADTYHDLDRTQGLLEHFVQHGHKDGRLRKLNVVPQHVRQELGEISVFEPDIAHVGGNIDRVVRYPSLGADTYIPRLIQRQFAHKPSVVVCVPFLSVGGSDLIATYVLKAMEQHYGVDQVLMIVTDRTENSVGSWLNSESNVIFLDQDNSIASLADRTDLLHSVLGYLQPEKVININSHAAWCMYCHYGKQLSQKVELNAHLFCFDYDRDGRIAGYIRDYVPRTIQYMSSVYCDNSTVIQDIRNLYGFADEQQQKFHTVYVPTPEGLEAPDPEGIAVSNKPFLWIGRLARQKRPELLIEIARRMPQHQFVAYGPAGDSPMSDTVVAEQVDNIEYRGVYTSFEELDLSEFSFYLNTSAWEGLPTMIIQMMGVGLPVMTSKAGGIDELVGPSTGWLVPDDSDPSSYVTEIRQLLIHPEIARKRARAGVELATQRHSWTAFVSRLQELGAFEGANKGASDGAGASKGTGISEGAVDGDSAGEAAGGAGTEDTKAGKIVHMLQRLAS